MPNFDSLTTEELRHLVEFSQGERSDPPQRINPTEINSSLVMRAIRELNEMGVLIGKIDVHYDGCALG
jgi:hypothetical protein